MVKSDSKSRKSDSKPKKSDSKSRKSNSNSDEELQKEFKILMRKVKIVYGVLGVTTGAIGTKQIYNRVYQDPKKFYSESQGDYNKYLDSLSKLSLSQKFTLYTQGISPACKPEDTNCKDFVILYNKVLQRDNREKYSWFKPSTWY